MIDINSIQYHVDRGIRIRAEMEVLKQKLDESEKAIIKIAKTGEHVPLADDEREGKQFKAHGTAQIVPVIFTADKIVASFKNGSQIHSRIVPLLAGVPISAFYKPSHTWEMVPKDGKAFRKAASDMLGDKAAPFITACKSVDKFGIPKSDIKIEWEAAKPV